MALEGVSANADWARKHLNLDLVCAGDAVSTVEHLPTHFFDAVVSNAGLQYLRNDMRIICTALKVVVTALRVGGCAWFGWIDAARTDKALRCLSNLHVLAAASALDVELFGHLEYSTLQQDDQQDYPRLSLIFCV